MSKLNVDNIENRLGTGGPQLPGATFTDTIVGTAATFTGIVTATSFDGNLTGNLTGNVTGNADTATYADVAGIATVAENLTGNPTISVTDITATGNVSIAGTLTYEDVTNVDSIGIITARTGVRVLAGGVDVISGGINIDAGGLVVTGVTTTSNLIVENSAFTAITTTSINKTIVNREFTTAVGVGTTAGITVTLPASPQPGWLTGVGIAGTFTDTIVARNGSNIMGLSEDMTIDVAYLNVSFLYIDSIIGWKVI